MFQNSDDDDIDLASFDVVGTCEDIEKPYLRLTSVSSLSRIFLGMFMYVI